ncbi:hypothetical protein [Streptomyces sp. NPDC007905]|uniref:hypothetical protein n=1 Tax=Streptomyces sp. NPDC007905 TaxID=3364788 RepID=UPI0036EC0F10
METMRQLRDRLNTSFDGTAPDAGQEAHRFIREIGTMQGFRSLLATILRDGPFLSEVAAASYAHSNGFDKIVLAAGPANEYKLRLHMWRPDREPHSEHIHNHRWKFGSVVLAGEMQMEFFELASGGRRLERYRYSRALGPGRFSTRRLGSVEVQPTYAGTVGAGASYWLRNNVFHRINVARDGLVATLVLQAAALSPDCELLTSDPLGHHSVVEPRKFNEVELADRIDSLLGSTSI